MNFAVPGAGRADLLTHTTLQLGPGLSAATAAQVTLSLQHVPGVLLAEVHPDHARAVVSHDAAVLPASLVAAAAAAGAHAKVLAGARPNVLGGTAPGRLGAAQIRYLATLATLAFISLALVDMFIPNGAERRYASIVISAFWVFFFAQVIVGRRS